jgi:hypothetical protein
MPHSSVPCGTATVSHAVRRTACSVAANAGLRRLLISPTKTIHCKVLRSVGSSRNYTTLSNIITVGEGKTAVNYLKKINPFAEAKGFEIYNYLI